MTEQAAADVPSAIVPVADGITQKVTCANCQKELPLEEMTVKRWKADGTVGQASCRPCGAIRSRLARDGLCVGLLEGEERTAFFARAATLGGPDLKKTFDEAINKKEVRTSNSADHAKGEYQLVSKLEETSPYKENPDALQLLIQNSFTLTGLDGLKRVWVPTYSREDSQASASQVTAESTLAARSLVAKAKAIAKKRPKKEIGDSGGSPPIPDPLQEYSGTLRKEVTKALGELEKSAKALQESLFVLADPSAQDYTSQALVRTGNEVISSCLAYISGIKEAIAKKVDARELEKMAKDCQESIKEAKRINKKLAGSCGTMQI